jgi:two-component system response regulator
MARHKVLLVEDNPDDIELARHAGDSIGVDADIVVVRDGEEALDYLFATGRHAGRAASDAPTFVILDLRLPGMGGLEVLRAIRGNPRTRRLPVVIFSASDAPEDVVNGYDLGANSFVRKPEGFEDFTGIVGNLERYWLGFNIMPPA